MAEKDKDKLGNEGKTDEAPEEEKKGTESEEGSEEESMANDKKTAAEWAAELGVKRGWRGAIKHNGWLQGATPKPISKAEFEKGVTAYLDSPVRPSKEVK